VASLLEVYESYKEEVRILVEKSVTIELETGLEARPAAHLVQEANRFSSDLFIEKDGKTVNAKSIMGLLSLAITRGEMIQLIANGPDEEEGVEHLTQFVSAHSC